MIHEAKYISVHMYTCLGHCISSRYVSSVSMGGSFGLTPCQKAHWPLSWSAPYGWTGCCDAWGGLPSIRLPLIVALKKANPDSVRSRSNATCQQRLNPSARG